MGYLSYLRHEIAPKSWCSLWKGGFGTNPPSGGQAESINKSNRLSSLSLLRARGAPPPRCGRLQAHRRTDLSPTISPFAIDLRASFAARLEALTLRRRCARTPKSDQLMPAQRPTDACGARGRQICSQQSLHLPSTARSFRLAP